MNCMKCGREIAEGQAFCPDCLAEMAKYPVKPGTTIQIPVQPPEAEVKKARHPKKRTPEDRIRWLRGAVRVLIGVIAALVIALAVTVKLLTQAMEQQQKLPLGQNYSTSQTTGETTN